MPLANTINDVVASANPDVRCLKWNGKPSKCEHCGCEFYLPADLSKPAAGHFNCLACTKPFDKFDGQGSLSILMPARNDWRTPGGSVMYPEPDGLFTTLHNEYRFNLDVAANAANTKCPLYYDGLTPEGDALLVNWFGSDLDRRSAKLKQAPLYLEPNEVRAFDNCPYKPKGTIEKWLTKALEQAALGVFSVHLIPMATSVAWFNDLVIPYAEWQSFRSRIPFGDPLVNEEDEDDGRTSPKQDNLLVIYDPNSKIVGHTTVRDAKTGKYLWRRPT